MTSQKRKIVSPVPKWDIAAKSLPKKQYVVFDFIEERPNRYLIIPDTWINGDKCYWPDPESQDEQRVAFLIRSHSEPNKSTWIQLPGRVKGRFNNYATADAYLRHCRTSESESGSQKKRGEDKENRSEGKAKRRRSETREGEDEGKGKRRRSEVREGEDNARDGDDEGKAMEGVGKAMRLRNEEEEVPSQTKERSPETKSSEEFNYIKEELRELRKLVKILVDKLNEQGCQKLQIHDAQEILKKWNLPVIENEQLTDLELRLNRVEERRVLRHALVALNPNQDVDPLHAARAICRMVCPDSVLQFYTIQRPGRSCFDKRILPLIHPNFYSVILGCIMKKTKLDFGKAVTALSRHLAKCGDRRMSKEARKFRESDSDGSGDTVIIDQSSCDDSSDYSS